MAASPASLVTAAGFSISRVSGGSDVVDVRAVLLGQDRLVLVGEQDVAAAVGERGGRLTGRCPAGRWCCSGAWSGTPCRRPRRRCPPVACAHAARMFHRAEPDEPGFGVMISTPGSTRSSQVSMPSGLPLRTTKTTTEEVAMPLVGVVLPVLGDQALADQTSHVGLEGVVDDVGLRAGHDGPALVARGAVRRLELDPVTGIGALEVLEDALVGGLQDREPAQLDASRRHLRSHHWSPPQALKASTPASVSVAATLIFFIISSSLSPPTPERSVGQLSRAE